MSSPELGAAVIAQLLAQGVTDIVVAPGSRSGPLSVAADLSDARVHVRIDERSASFLALGIARGQGRPVAVITTSGTAVGNLLPAVMEAHHSAVPLVVVSADRPSSLVGTGANQTTHQSGLFGGFVRESVRVASSEPPRSWPALVARAVIAAAGTRSAHPGPAHINVELADPLLGDEQIPAAQPVRAARPGRGAPLDLEPGPATVVVAGDASPQTGGEASAFAQIAELPLIAEPSSNARSGSAALSCGRLLLDTALGAQIRRVVVFGHPTLSRPVTRLLSRDDVEIVAVSDRPSWTDPTWRVHTVASGVRLDAGDASWLRRWTSADERLAATVATEWGTTATGWRMAADTLASLTDTDVLFVGPSQIVRDLDLAPIHSAPPAVHANRGLAGIDGVVSTAVGVALGTGAPVHLLCGDLTFLHDSNGLLPGSGPPPDLRIVVADDNGGSIFSTLEAGGLPADTFERIYRTPQNVDLVDMARAFGAAARRVPAAGLAAALTEPVAGLQVIVVPIDSSGVREQSLALPRWAAAAAS